MTSNLSSSNMRMHCTSDKLIVITNYTKNTQMAFEKKHMVDIFLRSCNRTSQENEKETQTTKLLGYKNITFV